MFLNRLMIPSLMSQSTSCPLIIPTGETPATGHGSGLVSERAELRVKEEYGLHFKRYNEYHRFWDLCDLPL